MLGQPENTFYHHPGVLPPATRVLELLSQKSVKMLIRIAFWSSQVLPSGRTEVLTKGGTGFLGASRAWKVCPGGLPLLCLTMDEHFHKKMMIRIRFFNPKWGEPKYSLRVVPERTEVLNRGGTHV